jgi:hypothetical protein
LGQISDTVAMKLLYYGIHFRFSFTVMVDVRCIENAKLKTPSARVRRFGGLGHSRLATYDMSAVRALRFAFE